MRKVEISEKRNAVLGKILLVLFRVGREDIPLICLSNLFEEQGLPVGAKFFRYTTFSKWVGRHPSLNVVTRFRAGRKTSLLLLDERAASFVESVTGEVFIEDDVFQPLGDPIFHTPQEVMP